MRRFSTEDQFFVDRRKRGWDFTTRGLSRDFNGDREGRKGKENLSALIKLSFVMNNIFILSSLGKIKKFRVMSISILFSKITHLLSRRYLSRFSRESILEVWFSFLYGIVITFYCTSMFYIVCLTPLSKL